jgi:hypothetical protein
LVTERTNCPKLDGRNTKLVQARGEDDGDVFGTLVPSKQVGQINLSELVADQVRFWCLVVLSGGLVAELAQAVAGLNQVGVSQ